MKNTDELCISCFNQIGQGTVCPHCGFNKNTYEPQLHHLSSGTILSGKYLIGKAIGEGGFGITYIGYDLNLEIRVAIKEYFPNGFVARNVSNTDAVTIFSGEAQEIYEQGREKFINEAKALAKFDNLPGIVSVKDFFTENGTAYIVMEYIEGETLKSFLQKNGGKADPENIRAMLKPLIGSLAQVHGQGLIHRDISPENIMITQNDGVKLLDFGAARDISVDGQKSLSIQLRPGYAPEEQYRSHGSQGPWTDVYALCATMYHAITGKQPLESLERLHTDTLQKPSDLGIAIDPAYESALMHGLAVFANQRTRSMDELYNEMYNGKKASGFSNVEIPVNKQSDTSKLLLAAIISGGVILIALIIFAAVFFASSATKVDFETLSDVQQIAEKVTPIPTEIPVPSFNKVEASSTRGTDMTSGLPVEYYPIYAIDGDYTTTWSPNRNYGLNPTFTLLADTPQYVSGIRMANGYFKSTSTYTRNRRITKVKVEYEGGEKTQDLDINQYRVLQDIQFDAPSLTSYIKITVLDTYYGDWKDICISEIEVY